MDGYRWVNKETTLRAVAHVAKVLGYPERLGYHKFWAFMGTSLSELKSMHPGNGTHIDDDKFRWYVPDAIARRMEQCASVAHYEAIIKAILATHEDLESNVHNQPMGTTF